jgi:hypothetical protein
MTTVDFFVETIYNAGSIKKMCTYEGKTTAKCIPDTRK